MSEQTQENQGEASSSCTEYRSICEQRGCEAGCSVQSHIPIRTSPAPLNVQDRLKVYQSDPGCGSSVSTPSALIQETQIERQGLIFKTTLTNMKKNLGTDTLSGNLRKKTTRTEDAPNKALQSLSENVAILSNRVDQLSLQMQTLQTQVMELQSTMPYIRTRAPGTGFNEFAHQSKPPNI